MKSNVYFTGLNGLRFFAAFAVIFHHIEQNKYWEGLPNLWGNPIIDSLGHKGVSLFFVLSGFLITYLLLSEIKVSGTVNLPKFYMRRALRIWPLYYLIIAISFFVLPLFVSIGNVNDPLYDNLGWKLLLFVFFLPNVARLAFPPVLGANQTWSVGVEEQFYLVWPILVRVFRNSLLTFLLCFIALKIALMLGLAYALTSIEVTSAIAGKLRFISKLIAFLQIEQMAIGAIGAYILFFKKEQVLGFIFNKYTQLAMVVALVVIMVVPMHFIGSTLIEALVFVTLVMNLSCNKSFPLKMENKNYTFLGNISYGIYMFHNICIAICLYLLKLTGLQTSNFVAFHILLTVSSIALTILISGLSYTYFENYFLRFKDKFAVIKSGSNHQKQASVEKSKLATESIDIKVLQSVVIKSEA